MKNIRSLFIIAIGMMVLTVTANTTAKLEQKQKTELVQELTKTYDVNVVNEYNVVSVYADAIVFKVESNPVKILDASPDVGLLNSEQNFTKINYKEKLLENYNTEFLEFTHKANRIRHCC